MAKWTTDARWKASPVMESTGGTKGVKPKTRIRTVHFRLIQGFAVRVIQEPGGWAFKMMRDGFEFKARELPSIGRAKSLAYDVAHKLAFLPDQLRGR
jgi:hypothetical protein